MHPSTTDPLLTPRLPRRGRAPARAQSKLRFEIGSGVLAFIGFYLAGSMGLFAALFAPHTHALDATGNPALFAACWLGMYCATVIMLMRYRYSPTRLELAFLALALIPMLSAGWSADPTRSAIYGTMFWFNMVFVVFMCRCIDIKRLMAVLLWVIVIMAAAGLVLSFLGVEQVRYIDPHSRLTLIGSEPIRGLSNHKITAGFYSALGFVLALVVAKGWTRYGICALLIYFNLRAGSSLGHGMLVLGSVLLLLVRLLSYVRLPPAGYVTVLAISLTATLFGGSLFVGSVAEALGRDATLTGRTSIWEWGTQAASERPLIGWGFKGYFSSESALTFTRGASEFGDYQVPHFHNSFIQMAVEFGYLGFALLMAAISYALYHAYARVVQQDRAPAALAACVALLLTVVVGNFDLFWINYNECATIMLATAALIAMRRRTLRKPSRRRPADRLSTNSLARRKMKVRSKSKPRQASIVTPRGFR